ncbi:MAG: hypothetical protein HYZ66_09425, partial [Chlamydiae bacterium]|nr:hypothetical protein [Chlamydiota bacterium]
NITEKDGVTRTHNELNQITSTTDGTTLAYDNNGNITSKVVGGITWTYAFSSENRLLSASSSDGTNVTFQYDALGRRISKSDGTTTTSWIYDGEDILLEYQNGILTNRYTQGPGTDEHLALTNLSTGQNYYYHTDALGSTTEITDSTGSIVESYQYTSFGQPTIFDKDGLKITQSSIGNIYQYTGREFDTETGLQDSRERYYDPLLQRFISKDPIGMADDVNLYAYVENAVPNYTDPYGLMTFGSTPESNTGPNIPPPEPGPGPITGVGGGDEDLNDYWDPTVFYPPDKDPGKDPDDPNKKPKKGDDCKFTRTKGGKEKAKEEFNKEAGGKERRLLRDNRGSGRIKGVGVKGGRANYRPKGRGNYSIDREDGGTTHVEP